ncbi:MAG: transposase [Burkholderiaceae bacterium]|jgi:transposase
MRNFSNFRRLRNISYLSDFMSHCLKIPNNAMERCIRPIAVGRNNYMFVGSVRGGQVAATMYSLLSTARLNGLNPYDWLKDTLTRLPSHPSNKVHGLLPLTRQGAA